MYIYSGKNILSSKYWCSVINNLRLNPMSRKIFSVKFSMNKIFIIKKFLLRNLFSIFGTGNINMNLTWILFEYLIMLHINLLLPHMWCRLLSKIRYNFRSHNRFFFRSSWKNSQNWLQCFSDIESVINWLTVRSYMP